MNLLRVLGRDLQLYKPDYPSIEYCSRITTLAIAACKCRDFRLNILIRVHREGLPLLSRLAGSLSFYIYGCSIDAEAALSAPIRFIHPRNIVIGKHVSISGPYCIIFHNVTLGKLRPGSPSVPGSMPRLSGGTVIGTGSVILGTVVTEGDTVFGACTLCTDLTVPGNCTVVGTNHLLKTVYYHPASRPVLSPAY